ncbi:ABC transporter permease [Mycoplasma nasistruthionis]|uniref:ABC transporter permease n=1 Tax=Mycoplasma nasistruthionis TaxID=353852 RepID=A0A5B7XVK1_9MOLU|nr:ABC transporter permease [Mycoplasma nasistruthionis]QCZ36465.1 ABC transporter permease [Mycoplasma nasistruthionis]
MNAREFEKKYKLSLDNMRSSISAFAPESNAALNNIAGKPKKLIVEIFKRFFSNWVAVVSLFVFLTIFIMSIVITTSAKYSSTEPLYKTLDFKYNVADNLSTPDWQTITASQDVTNLPPVFSPWYNPEGNISNFEKLTEQWSNPNYYGGALWKLIYFGENNTNNYIKLETLTPTTNRLLVNAYAFYKVKNIEIILNKLVEARHLSTDMTLAEANSLIKQIEAWNPQLNLSTYLGTNARGIDIWTLSWVGTWQAIRLAIIVATIQTLIGVAIGAYLGFHVGSFIDTAIMRLIDIFVAPPTLIWLLIFAATFGTTDLTLALALIFVGWVGSVGSTRLFVITVKDQEFITASKSVGASKARLIYKHALPAIIGKISTSYVASIPSIILSVSSLAFLGFFKSDSANLGAILSNAAAQAGNNPFILVLPAMILLLISVSLHFVALGVHDALDPKVIRAK